MRDASTNEPSELIKERKPLIAPWWHTVLIVAIILSVSVLGLSRRSDVTLTQHHLREYGATLGWEWLLLALTLGGVWLRGRTAGVQKLFSGERYSWAQDAWAAALFWIPSTIVLGIFGALLKRAGGGTPQQVLSALAPRTGAELALFLALSVSAGFCEELIFRGYLMEQCTRLAALVSRGREGAWIGVRIEVWLGALASSIVFGAAHLYEGVSGVIAITIFGLMFAWLALRRRSLRAGMLVHAWHDAVSGIALYLLTRAHAI